jgi:hypothetical protein
MNNFGVFIYSVYRFRYRYITPSKTQTRNDDEYINTFEYMTLYPKTKRALIALFLQSNISSDSRRT